MTFILLLLIFGIFIIVFEVLLSFIITIAFGLGISLIVINCFSLLIYWLILSWFFKRKHISLLFSLIFAFISLYFIRRYGLLAIILTIFIMYLVTKD